MPKAKVSDIEVHYEVHGEGFPLIMIRGLSANLDWWDPRMIQELSKKFRVLVFDNRGAGRTEISDKKYTIELLADDVVGLMNALEISKAHVLGISMGGMIAQELVLKYSENVEKLVLCSTYCGGSRSVLPSQRILGMLATDRSPFSPKEIAKMMIPLFLTDEFINKNPAAVEFWVQQTLKAPISNEAYIRQLNAIMEFDTYNRLNQIKAPTLILHGKHDVLVPPENGAILSKAIPNARLVYFENSAHGLVEEMKDVIRTLQNFLASF